MGIFGTLFDSGSPMPWDLGEVPGRKPSLRLEDVYDMTPSAEAKYPESVWAPPHDIGRGPASDPYPEPYEFKRRELVAACRQAMKMSGLGEKYPRPWTINSEPTNYMAFPILPGQRLWAGGEAGRFRIVYQKFDGAFYRVVMHRYTTPLAERETSGLGFCWVGEKCGHESPFCPLEQNTRLVKSPPQVAHPSSARESHPLRQNPLHVKSPPLAASQPCNTMSPILETESQVDESSRGITQASNNDQLLCPGEETHIVKSLTTATRRHSHVQSHPLVQKNVLVKSPHLVTPKASNVQSSPPSQGARLVKPPPTVSRQLSQSSIIPSPVVDQNGRFVQSSPTITRQLSIIPSPVLDQDGRFSRSPPTKPHVISNTQSPIIGYDPRLPRSPQSPIIGYDPRLPRSPRPAARSFSFSQSPVLGQESPLFKSPPTTPHAFSNLQSPIVGYDPRLPRSPRVAGHPFSNNQSPVLSHETTPVRSPAVGMHPSRYTFSPVIGQDPRLVKSPSVIQVTHWPNQGEIRRASHA